MVIAKVVYTTSDGLESAPFEMYLPDPIPEKLTRSIYVNRLYDEPPPENPDEEPTAPDLYRTYALDRVEGQIAYYKEIE